METPLSVNDAIASGYQHFDSLQYGDALRCFNQALQLAPDNDAAKHAYNQLIQLIVPRWHFSMLNDAPRNDIFEAAIRAAVNENTTVLDVGSGSGLLAMMAARAGAKMIYTCEMVQPIADIAKEIIAANGYADKIKVISKKSDAVMLGEDIDAKVDVLITETVDSGLIGEGIIPIIIDAKERLLVEGGQIIPCSATVYAALVEAEQVWGWNRVSDASGFDVSLFNRYATEGFFPIRLDRFPHKFLSQPCQVCSFNFSADELKPRSFNLPLQITQSGDCHAIAYWFDLDLDPSHVYTNSPANPDSHWKQAVYCLPTPTAVSSGQKTMQLSVQQELTKFDFSLT